MMTLEQLVELAGRHAYSVLVERHLPALEPCWVLDEPDGQLRIIGTPWSDEHEKEIAAKIMRLHMRQHHTRAYSLVTEAWTAKAPEGWDPDTPLPQRPAERPDRQEVVIAVATDGRENQWRSWAIKRDWNERVVALEPRPMEGELTSWMTDLLK
jgi:hypothetical protein